MTPSKNADELNNTAIARRPSESIARRQAKNVRRAADHDLCIKRQQTLKFAAQFCPRDRLPNHERARCSDIDDVVSLEQTDYLARPETPMAADIDAFQENDERHSRAGEMSPTTQP